MENELNLSETQLKMFEKTWWIYGNDGPKCTFLNHKLVQGFYQYQENRIDAYLQGNKNMRKTFGKEYSEKHGVTKECIEECKKILNTQ